MSSGPPGLRRSATSLHSHRRQLTFGPSGPRPQYKRSSGSRGDRRHAARRMHVGTQRRPTEHVMGANPDPSLPSGPPVWRLDRHRAEPIPEWKQNSRSGATRRRDAPADKLASCSNRHHHGRMGFHRRRKVAQEPRLQRASWSTWRSPRHAVQNMHKEAQHERGRWLHNSSLIFAVKRPAGAVQQGRNWTDSRQWLRRSATQLHGQPPKERVCAKGRQSKSCGKVSSLKYISTAPICHEKRPRQFSEDVHSLFSQLALRHVSRTSPIWAAVY